LHANVRVIPVETVPRMGGEGRKESSAGCEFKHDIFDAL
jgi:hypothetical protein